MSVLNTPITKLRGIGPVKAEAYAKQNIFTAGDLICHYPRAYENRGNIELLSDITDPEIKHAVVLTVAREPKTVRIRSRNM